jgi:hypothetical protein
LRDEEFFEDMCRLAHVLAMWKLVEDLGSPGGNPVALERMHFELDKHQYWAHKFIEKFRKAWMARPEGEIHKQIEHMIMRYSPILVLFDSSRWFTSPADR